MSEHDAAAQPARLSDEFFEVVHTTDPEKPSAGHP
jgi:hypothetical protein